MMKSTRQYDISSCLKSYSLIMDVRVVRITVNVLLHRSNRPEVFCKNGVLRNFAKFTGKHLCQRLFFTAGLRLLLKRYFFDIYFKVCSQKFIFGGIPFKKRSEAVVRRCSVKKVLLIILQC